MFVVEDDDEAKVEEFDNPYQLECTAQKMVLSADVSSLHSLAGQNNPRSLRVWGRFKEKQLIVLIDSGATHNFVQPSVVERLKIPTQDIPPFHVYVGNGDTLTCTRLCPKVELNLQGVRFDIDLYVLPIQGPDLVLRVQWLQSLGRVAHDYGQDLMEFEYKGVTVQLKGEPTAEPQPVSFSQLQALINSSNVEQYFEIHSMAHGEKELHAISESDVEKNLAVDLSCELYEIIKKFHSLFNAPNTLPPKRRYDHPIHLLPNSKIVNVNHIGTPFPKK